MTRHVKIGEAKTHLSALLAEVEAGEELVICRGPDAHRAHHAGRRRRGASCAARHHASGTGEAEGRDDIRDSVLAPRGAYALMAFVPDASVAAAWLLPDEEAALADLAFDRLANEKAKVPDLFWHELRNLLLSAERRGRIGQRHADESLARLRRLPIHCPGEADDGHVMALARGHRLTAYDASYLALAIREGCPLVSLDQRLSRAAGVEGVSLFF